MHPFACYGMDEGNGLCLKLEAVSLVTVHFIILDWTAKSVWMGTMHSQLVGSPSMGPECQKRELGTVG